MCFTRRWQHFWSIFVVVVGFCQQLVWPMLWNLWRNMSCDRVDCFCCERFCRRVLVFCLCLDFCCSYIFRILVLFWCNIEILSIGWRLTLLICLLLTSSSENMRWVVTWSLVLILSKVVSLIEKFLVIF